MTRHTVVPDFCVLLSKFPGMFPLVIELKPAGQESEGFFQNVQQMLSKLFFQDVVFGMVISPKTYQLTVIMKIKGYIRFASTGAISLISSKANVYKLDMDKPKSMCTFIYRVLKWALKTNCIWLKTKKTLRKRRVHKTPTTIRDGHVNYCHNNSMFVIVCDSCKLSTFSGQLSAECNHIKVSLFLIEQQLLIEHY